MPGKLNIPNHKEEDMSSDPRDTEIPLDILSRDTEDPLEILSLDLAPSENTPKINSLNLELNPSEDMENIKITGEFQGSEEPAELDTIMLNPGVFEKYELNISNSTDILFHEKTSVLENMMEKQSNCESGTDHNINKKQDSKLSSNVETNVIKCAEDEKQDPKLSSNDETTDIKCTKDEKKDPKLSSNDETNVITCDKDEKQDPKLSLNDETNVITCAKDEVVDQGEPPHTPAVDPSLNVKQSKADEENFSSPQKRQDNDLERVSVLLKLKLALL